MYPAEQVAQKLDPQAVQPEEVMAHFETCPCGTGRLHVVSDEFGRIVCAADKEVARGAVRNGLQLGLINLADHRRLHLELNANLTLPERAPDRLTRLACGYPHTFVRSPLEALTAMCGPTEPHQDDVN